MANISYICIVWITICVETLSFVRHVIVSGTVGSTVVLPCELASVGHKESRIRWGSIEELVFERKDGESFQGERFQDRVDVPLDELRKGNCSLVLHNLSLSDAGTYIIYNTTRSTLDQTSHYSTPEELQIGKVELLVSSEVMKSPHPLVLVLSLVSCLLVQLFCR
ncbi:versican core protein-like [Clarias gariepinus]|uniref:versican core protein-like n=1 Tax=Clarias gariepinus TaxID=13013 RepID=UPI00234C71E1|nr:versican core protein-like [Clarias gariepinus]